jgi:hypothetical protein
VELEGEGTKVADLFDDYGSQRGKAERDPLYLFACHVLWHRERNLKAYQELVAALDDCDPKIRAVAEDLLPRASPRPVCRK